MLPSNEDAAILEPKLTASHLVVNQFLVYVFIYFQVKNVFSLLERKLFSAEVYFAMQEINHKQLEYGTRTLWVY